MSKKPLAQPHIEDATFAACLAPLAVAWIANADAEIRSHGSDWGPPDPPRIASRPADLTHRGPAHRLRNDGAVGDACILPGATGVSPTPQALAEWRSLADQEFAAFCTIESFLAKTDAELADAALAYPRQIAGFLERMTRMENRRSLQHQVTIELMARLQMAMIEAEIGSGRELPRPATARGAPSYPYRRKE